MSSGAAIVLVLAFFALIGALAAFAFILGMKAHS